MNQPNDENNAPMETVRRPTIITLCEQPGQLLKDHGDVLNEIRDSLKRIEKNQSDFVLGTEEKPGIVSRVVGLEAFKTGFMRAMWIVLSVVLTASAVAIISPLMEK